MIDVRSIRASLPHALAASVVSTACTLAAQGSGDGTIDRPVLCGAGNLVDRVAVEDLNGDGQVGADDLDALLEAYGPCSGACHADLDGSGAAGFPDLLSLLVSWGRCPRRGEP